MRFSRKAEVVLVGTVCLFEPSRDRFGRQFRERIFENKNQVLKRQEKNDSNVSLFISGML